MTSTDSVEVGTNLALPSTAKSGQPSILEDHAQGSTTHHEPTAETETNPPPIPTTEGGQPGEEGSAQINTATQQDAKYPEHPAGDEIRQQVEFYFSDGNLPTDAHLLMKTGGVENKLVSIKHIAGFGKMRKYKPYTAVVGSLKRSAFLDVVDDKFIRRKTPLTIEPKVTPEKIEQVKKDERKKKIYTPPADQPWLTKGLMKPTGFEEFWADAPITPAMHQENQELYQPEITFETRIETAIQRFKARRKFHTATSQAFDRFMKYGGIDSGPKAFSGSNQKDLEDKDAAQIAAMTATHYVSQDVVLNLEKWEVDFEAVAKSFLSCHMMTWFSCVDPGDIKVVVNVLRNFYNYLLHHNVCPEYDKQIQAARRICSIADRELHDVVLVNAALPGAYNNDVSRLYGGRCAEIWSDDQSWSGADNIGLTEEESKVVVKAAIAAHGTEEQYRKVSHSMAFQIVYEEELSFEVTELEKITDEVRKMYDDARKTHGFLKTMGKMHCRRWTYPLAPRFACSEEAQKRQKIEPAFVLWIEEDILARCFPGMKIEGNVRELDIGVKWLDSVRAVNCSFFEVIPNEYYEKKKQAVEEVSAAENMRADVQREPGTD